MTLDPLDLLARIDKWFLGGGKGALYAPPFPRHLTTPGFWDECYLADLRIPRLFTVLFLDQSGKPVKFRSKMESWRPDRLLLTHEASGIRLRETRCVTEKNAWTSTFDLIEGEPLHAISWAMLDMSQPDYGMPWNSVGQVDLSPSTMAVEYLTAWPADIEPDRTAVEKERLQGGSGQMLPPLPIHLALGGSLEVASFTANLAQRHDDSPLYELSMLPEKFGPVGLPGENKVFVGPEPYEGLLHLYQHYRLSPGQTLVVACGAGLSAAEASESLSDALAEGVVERNEAAWRRYFDSVPQFFSSDLHLTAAYWYRWYGLRLNTVDMPGLPVSGSKQRFSPFVTEGIGFFRNFITYSAQAHLREVAWMRDPSLALGILENLTKVQREDGSYPGHNYSARPARDFYHADFATGLRTLNSLHGLQPDKAVLDSLKRYARYFTSDEFGRWDETAGALVFDMNETGQEYMSRYQFVSEQADRWASFRVGGRDSNAYVQELLSFLIETEGADEWEEALMRFTAYVDGGWDHVDHFYYDVLPGGTRSTALPSTGFYPLIYLRTVDHARVECLHQWLLNPNQFWLPKGFPATALSDPTFSAEGEWKEKRLNCPWNGRSWPMTNSHLVDAIANVARRSGNEHLRKEAGRALLKSVTLMVHDGNPMRPNSYEHYDPVSGVPALYRGYDDYMHSWIVDLILRHVVGVQPGEDTVDPLPLDLDWVKCTGIPHPMGSMAVTLERGQEPSVEITPRESPQ